MTPHATTIRTTAGRGRLFESILDTVGDTPSIRINNLSAGVSTIYVKAEFFNPAASVKDRLALNIVEEGERSGA
ncbi:MAG: pyridoxal-phosphate dependent enzyme, partial [Roseiarcus sp.]